MARLLVFSLFCSAVWTRATRKEALSEPRALGGPPEHTSPEQWMLNHFLPEGDVDANCFRRCYERWLPEAAPRDPYLTDHLSLFESWDEKLYLGEIVEYSSEWICSTSQQSRAFQRCFISACGGLYARLPHVEIANETEPSFLDEAWSIVSANLRRYSPVHLRPLFPDHDFRLKTGGKLDYRWAPIPVGITAACTSEPGRAFSEDSPRGLSGLKGVTSTSGRWVLPPSIRRLLSPMWSSPSIMDHWSHNSTDHDYIDDPRPLSELREKIIPTYLFSLLAHAHLLSLTSASPISFLEGALQLLASTLIPTFPAVQILHNALTALYRVLRGRSWTAQYLLAGIAGVVLAGTQGPSSASHRTARLLDVDLVDLRRARAGSKSNGRWMARLVGILANLAVLSYTAAAYCARLSYSYEGRAFVAAMGFDHRVGWIAVAATAPVLATLVLHLINREWHSAETCAVGGWTDWKLRFSLDLIAATQVLEILLLATGRITASYIVACRFLGDHLPAVIELSALVFALSILMRASLAMITRNLTKWLRCLAVTFSVIYALLVFMLQIYMDMEEYADLAAGFVLPWNHRWQVASPAWSKWWGL